MTGHERPALVGLTVGVVVDLLLLPWLAPRFGATGAAIARAAGLVAWNLALAFAVRRRLGFGVEAFSQIPMSTRPPIIVLGAHRSGTSALARVLEALGVFAWCVARPESRGARFFLELDERLLAQCGARWDQPAAIHWLLDDEGQSRLAVEHLARCMRAPRAREFLGLRRWLANPRLDRQTIRWGWKDPRATFTLPLWLRVFPDARVLHVHRHGVDVAHSLCRRHREHLARSEAAFERTASGRVGCASAPASATSAPAVRHADGWLHAVEEYVREARRHVAALGPNALELRYEDLAARPLELVREVARFCELDVDEARLGRAASIIAKDRAGAHRHDQALVAPPSSLPA